MKRLDFGILLFLLCAVPAFSQNADHSAVETQIQQNENTLNQAWKSHDSSPFAKLLTEDSVDAYDGGGDSGKAAIMKSISSDSCTVNSIALSDFKYQWLDKDAVIVTSNSTQDATCGGQKLPPKSTSSSVWVNRDGKWMCAYHVTTTAATQ